MKKLDDYLYYEEKNPDLKIYHGDCVEVMKHLTEVNILLTDPPYGMEFRSNHRTIKYDKIKGDECFPIEIIETAKSLATHASYVFCRWDNLRNIPKPKSVIAWIKNNWSMGDLEHEHGRQWEACCFYPGANHKFYERIPDVIRCPRTDNDYHPTQKPVGVVRRIIESNHGDVVLDPFLGSGTTLMACKELERRGIGIEIEEKYCEIAKKRLKATTKTLFQM